MMKKTKINILRTLAISCLLVYLVSSTGLAAAHTDGKLQLSAVPAGAYQLSVWTSPDPATVGELHVAISVVLAEDASPVLDADVTVLMTNQEDGSTISGEATTENSENKFLYEAILEPKSPGLYELTIQIIGADDRQGGVAFSLELMDASGFNSLYFIPVLLVIIAGGVYYYYNRRNSQPAGY